MPVSRGEDRAMDEQPTMEEMWMLLQEQRAMMEEQRAEIAGLKGALAAHQQEATRSSQQSEAAAVPGRLLAGAGVGTEEAPAPQGAGNGAGPEQANAHHPEALPVAPRRKGWRPRLGG